MRSPFFRRSRSESNLFTGAVLVVLGVALLLKNYDILPIRSLLDFWPVFPLMWGLQLMSRGRSVFGYLVGGLIMSLSTLKLLDNFGVISVSSKLYGPLILMGVGFAFLASNLRQSQEGGMDCSLRGGEDGDSMATRINPMVMFGGVKRRVSSQEFEGGEIMAMFGGVEIDFRKAKLKGAQASIEANAMFGGIHLRVPESWTVEVRGTRAFGGYEDKTMPPRPEDNLPVQKLILTGNALFGGIVVEN